MRVEYTGRRLEVPEEVRRLGDRKLRKLAKVLPGITDVHVILAASKHRLSAEVKVHSPRLDLAAAEESADLGESLSAVVDKLTRQAQRHVGKRHERKRRAPARPVAAPAARAPRARRRTRGASPPPRGKRRPAREPEA